MRIGVQPPTAGPQATPEFILRFTELAERLGFDSVQITDHIVVPVEIESRYPYSSTGRMAAGPDDVYWEPLSLIAYLAGKTSRIRLGTSVLIAAYRHPVVTAKQLACLDALSGGRIVIGMGVGWMAEEFRIMGAPPFDERGAATEEVVEIFRRIWRDQPAEFHGRYWSFSPIGAMPKPVQPGGIPIVLGGDSRPAIRRAARIGDGWQPFKLPPDELRPRLGYLREQAQVHGRDLSSGFTLSLRLGLRLTAGRPAERRPREEPWQTLVGTAEQVAADLEAYHALGVSEVVFDFRTCRQEEAIESLRLAAEGLLPRVAQGEESADQSG